MNLTDAAYHTVHDYPGGAEALAPRLGKRGTSLCHEVDPRNPVAKLGLLDAARIMQMSGDLRMLHAQASQVGALVVELPLPGACGACTHAHVASVAREFGELMHEIAVDTADGVITANELRRLEREWGDLVAAGSRLMGQLRAQHAAGRPEQGGAAADGAAPARAAVADA